MIWKDGHRRGEIVSEEGDFICIVQTVRIDKIKIEPWPKGKANFRLILAAPQMLEALEAIVALKAPDWCGLGEVLEAYNQHKVIARAAIAAVKGDGDDNSIS